MLSAAWRYQLHSWSIKHCLCCAVVRIRARVVTKVPNIANACTRIDCDRDNSARTSTALMHCSERCRAPAHPITPPLSARSPISTRQRYNLGCHIQTVHLTAGLGIKRRGRGAILAINDHL
ncbi:hypothetical protein NEOLEDRAFT_674003 [Neolentinus lepideus HHB14362 ss-1]|uniref:Uncharacterized protein n=1 Tax=Neolentinus lepideus HHB14362 ss-1 TaxID=1314782 RepID=A0A165QC00_9AGAM|nr:hypothetical protein NEOLEDRAFT_674003 [Neolentinus lepideus HHB14362 ss-1]